MKNKSLIILVIISLFLITPVYASTNAKTLAELRTELSNLKKQRSNNQKDKNLTQGQIKDAQTSVSNKREEISINQQKVIDATNESNLLEQDITSGKKQISSLMKSYQISSGDNSFLEYIFTSNSYADLIYKYAVMEMLMNYQDGKIGEWQEKIERNNQLKIDLEKREQTLNTQINSLSNEISKLGNKLDELDDMALDIDKEIQSVQNLINYYVKLGCGEKEDLEKCVKVRGDTSFRRPLVKGSITSGFGYRTHPVTGKTSSFHSGTDIGVKEGTEVFSIANGTVGKIVNKSSCGGNMVYVYHTINGKQYTSAYMHLLTIQVKLGDTVSSNTKIGLSGGSSTKSYDGCTTGGHLHLSLATGWYGSTYVSYSTWKANLINPRKNINLPSSWSTRD